MLGRRKAVPRERKIEKTEDKEWRRWYDGLDNKEHEQKLAMLGLDKEDIEEWEHHSVFQDIEQELGGEATTQLKEKKAKKAR